MFVLTLIARQESADLPALQARLNQMAPTLPFTQTYPDELQGAFELAEPALSALLLAARQGDYWLGLGVGQLTLPRFGAALGQLSIEEATGPARAYSRAAVEQAQTGAPPRAVDVQGADAELATQVTGALRLLYRVVSARTPAEWRVLDLLLPGVRGQQKAVAQALGISSQAVSKTLVRSLWHEELAARPLILSALQNLDAAGSEKRP